MLVLREPVAHRSQVRGIQAVQATASHCTTLDEPHLAENPEVLGDLRLRDRKFVDDRPDRLLPANQYVEDLPAVSLADRVEDVGSGGSPSHLQIVYL